MMRLFCLNGRKQEVRLLNNQRVEECHFSLPGQRIWAWPAYFHRVLALYNVIISNEGGLATHQQNNDVFFVVV